ncbi:hypothetical protein E8E11_009357 [Didymella keratinophila]|nr:hypothetical protein E8E11_009357 [Didymella keratinophila]
MDIHRRNRRYLTIKALMDLVMASNFSKKPVNPLDAAIPNIASTYSSAETDTSSKVIVENHAGYFHIPVGIAGPLKIIGSETIDDEFFAPLATVEPTLVASCS